MKKTLSTLTLIVFFFTATAQSSAVKEYIERYSAIAISEMIRSGVPASITLAQGILESQAGQSDLVKRSNNHFGIKCKSDWTGDKTYHDDDAKGECFRVYNNPEDSYKDHSDFLRTRAHYAFLFTLDPTDYEGWAKGLKKAGYATNPKYPQMLIKTIVENNLQSYTLIALNRQEKKNDDVVVAAVDKKILVAETEVNEKNIEHSDTVQKVKAQPAVITEIVASESTTKPVTTVPAVELNKYPAGIFEINGTKVVFSTAGTSLLAIARKHNISLQKLIEFNELEENADILENSQLIYLQKKNKKSTKDVHVVGLNETLYEIAQREGIRLQSLLELNRIPKGMEPAAGEKIYLKTNSPTTPKLVTSSAGKQ